MAQLGVLHTKSSYIGSAPSLPSITEDIKLNRIMSQINALKAKEAAFAKRFGYNSLEELIKGIRKILQGNPNDIRALKRFSSGNLQHYLEQFKQINSNMLINQKITLKLEGDQQKISNLFNIHGSNGDIIWDSEATNTVVLTKWDTKIIKDIVNKMYGTHFNKKSANIDNMLSFLQNDASNAVKVLIGNNEKTIDQFKIDNVVSPFGLKPTDLKAMVKTNPELVQELRSRITNFISDTLCAGASKEFINAAQQVAGAKFNSLESLAFFMGGKGWSTHALGAFGELQTAILFQYFANKTPNRTVAAVIANIIGDETNSYGQQYHTDIKILDAFGIQVKNYEGTYNFRTKEEKTVKVHLHPSEVASFGASEGVVDYIVNSYFNTSIEPYPENSLKDFFKAHASELLNLDFNPDIPDQVSFYMIGSNFIPGSAILQQAFQEVTLKVGETTMSGAKGKSDEEYLSGKHPSFLKWWHGNKSIGWVPTDNNSISAWDGKISITTSFTYSAVFDGAYKLF